MIFASDNWAGAAPEVMAALATANQGRAPAYGGDPATAAAQARIDAVFETETRAFFVATGGAANGLALSVLTPPYGMVVCHEESHVQMDECAGPEFFTGGAKLLPVAGADGKLDADGVRRALRGFPDRPPHGAPAAALTITQASECGTVYSVDDVKALADAAKGAGMGVHMDGARFANAVASLGCAPADVTWRAGVDVLSFGGTKNGCLAAEAVVFFDPAKAADFELRRKRAGQLFSKMRFFSAQFDAYLTDDLWLRLARKANAAARLLSAGLADIPGCKVWYPTDANEVFVSFPDGGAAALQAKGAVFYPWVTPGDPADGTMHRLICGFDADHGEIDRFLDVARGLFAA